MPEQSILILHGNLDSITMKANHVIRDEKSLDNIRRYIKNNPENWTEDEFNSENKKDNKTK